MQRVSEAGRDYEEASPGVSLADLAAGEKSSMKHWRIDPGATLPVHRHDNEQIGFLISGELVAVLEDEEVKLSPGDSYAFESGELHGAENRGSEPAIGIGVLSPPRSSPEWAQSAATAEEDAPVPSVGSND